MNIVLILLRSSTLVKFIFWKLNSDLNSEFVSYFLAGHIAWWNLHTRHLIGSEFWWTNQNRLQILGFRLNCIICNFIQARYFAWSKWRNFWLKRKIQFSFLQIQRKLVRNLFYVNVFCRENSGKNMSSLVWELHSGRAQSGLF